MPPSLRVYELAKAAPALFGGFSALDEAADLWTELEAYADAEARVAAEEAARQRRAARRGG